MTSRRITPAVREQIVALMRDGKRDPDVAGATGLSVHVLGRYRRLLIRSGEIEPRAIVRRQIENFSTAQRARQEREKAQAY